jgi:hypothetical protein
MDTRLLLVKAITLLYRESQIVGKNDNSSDLVRSAVETIAVPEIGMGINTERDMTLALKETVMDMCRNSYDHEYDKPLLLQRLRLNTSGDDKFYDILATGMENDLPVDKLLKTIVSLQRSINNHFTDQRIGDVLTKASFQFKHHKDKIKDSGSFLADLISQLEPLQAGNGKKDPGVMTDIDIGDDGAMQGVFQEVRANADGTGIMRTGWKWLNRMWNGGIRRGEYCLLAALEHKYKTGFSLSVFKQIAIYNTPYMFDPKKKPLLLRISTEDDLVLNLQFLYQNLKYNETRKPVYIKDISVAEMSAYVKSKMQINGYHVRMIRVDPSQWTHKHIVNKVLQLEAQGYEIHLLMMDYLDMIPTTGCDNSGPTGTDKRDMLRRIRTFCGQKRIAFFSPHQLNTRAKEKLQNGMPEENFVKEVSEKGMFSGCGQLGQDLDLETTIHKFRHNKETIFAAQVGKHRNNVVEEEDRFAMMKFPKFGMPIPDDLEDEEDCSFKKLSDLKSNEPKETFQF